MKFLYFGGVVFRRVLGCLISLGSVALAFPQSVLAQEIAFDTDVSFFTDMGPVALMLLWPAGLILLISSAMPEQEAPTTAVNLLMTWCVAALTYFAVGFAFQFGGIAQVSPHPELSGLYWEWYPLDQSVELDTARLWGVVALQGWGLTGPASTPLALRLFAAHVSLVGVAAMLPVSAIPYRLRGGLAMLVGLFTGLLLYPLAGNWVWGGGWLANMGTSLEWGHGFVDFGGASLVFLSGSLVALVALMFSKQYPVSQTDLNQAEAAEVVVTAATDRSLTVYDAASPEVEEEELLLISTPMPSAYLPLLGFLGAIFMVGGWFGVSAGSHTPTALNFMPALAMVNGVLAALAAAFSSAAYSWFTTREFNPLMSVRGIVAGLIVATASAPFVSTWVMVLAGLLMGVLLPLLIYFFEQRLDDSLGTLTTYGVSALISLLLLALFANGQSGQGWNNVGVDEYQGITDQGVSGLFVVAEFARDWPGQLQAQLLGIGTVAAWSLLIGFLLFQTIKTISDSWVKSGLEFTSPSRSSELEA
ncbi:MAG: hypothetical protein AAF485_22680 [Chloroflexota bacterium]